LNQEKELKKEDHLINFIKTFRAIEDAIEPFKDQRRDLRESYNENGWLTKEEMRAAVKAYRLVKQEEDFELLKEYFSKIKRTVGGV